MRQDVSFSDVFIMLGISVSVLNRSVVFVTVGQWRLPSHNGWATVEKVQDEFLRVHFCLGPTVPVQHHL